MNMSFRHRTIARVRFAGFCTPFRLVSGIAASHRDGGRRSLVLHWSRKRIARSHDRWHSYGPSGVLPVRLHLNFVYRMTAFTPGTKVASLSRSAVDRRMQLAVLHHHVDRASEIRSEFRSVVSPRMVDRNSNLPGISEQSSSPLIPGLRTVTPAQISLRKLHTTREQTRTVFLKGSERIDHIRTFKAHTNTRYRERETLRLRSREAGGAIAASVLHVPASRVFATTPELVWRKPQHEEAVHAAHSQSGRNTSLQPMAPERSREHKQAVPFDAPAGQRTNFQPVNLDARMLDRLADDVIHRVEKRIRIERERRGLL
jgi:hypothetical protein